jgi:hypothetical protein
MSDGKPYQHAGWEDIAGGDEPVRCEQCSYQFDPFEKQCRRCGWAPGDPVDESVSAGPGYDELRAEQDASNLEWQRCMWVAAVVVCVAAPVGYLIGQFTSDGPVGGAIIAAFVGGIVAGLIARPGDYLLGAVIGAVCAIVYLTGGFLAITAFPGSHRYGWIPSWGTLMAIGVVGGTAASLVTAWELSRRQQVF